MSDSILTSRKRKTASDYRAEADQLLADMRELEEKMGAERLEIDRLRGETRLLREESLRLERENQTPLRRITAMVG
jgi:hypothetical protein